MNFLGHSRISMEIDIKTIYGNFTGDFYKGRLENLNLPSDVKNGLFLHRKIDSISDTENILTEQIDKKFSIFRGVISDIIIDHFLALEWEELFGEDLNDSIKLIYRELDRYRDIYTKNFTEVYNWISQNDILYSYKNPENIKRTFAGISKRVRKGSILTEAYDELIKKYDLFRRLGIKEFRRTADLARAEYTPFERQQTVKGNSIE